MRAYIIADMVGCCGIWRRRQCEVGSREWRKARRQVTMDVNAAIEGLKRLGYPEIYVKDIHATGTNLKRHILLPGVFYEPGVYLRPVPILGKMKWANCAVLLGCHARTGSEEGFFPHTIREEIRGVFVNEKPVGEAQLLAALLGELNITTNFISGDVATLAQITDLMPWVETLEIPKDRQSNLRSLDGGTTIIRKRNEIRAKVERCCKPNFTAKQFHFELPVCFEVQFRTPEEAQFYNSWGLKQIDNRIIWTSNTFLAGFEQLMYLVYVPRQLKGLANPLFRATNFINRLVYV